MSETTCPTYDELVAPLATPDDPFVSHIGWAEDDRALCGAPFVLRSLDRPTDRPICEVCDVLRAALGLYP